MRSLIPLGQFQVITNDNLCIKKEFKQYKFPKSKKRRIRKKWSKRNFNYKLVENHYAFEVNGNLYMSTQMRDAMMKSLNAKKV